MPGSARGARRETRTRPRFGATRTATDVASDTWHQAPEPARAEEAPYGHSDAAEQVVVELHAASPGSPLALRLASSGTPPVPT